MCLAAGRLTSFSLLSLSFWRAPECVLQQSLSAASDVFALAHVVFSALTHGKKLCDAHNNGKAFRGIQERLARGVDLAAIPDGLRALVGAPFVVVFAF